MQVWNSWIWAFVRIWDCPRGHLVAFRCSGPCVSVFQYSVLWCQFGITVVLWLLQLCPFSRTWVVLDASHRHLSPWTNGGGGAWNETQYKNENTSPDCKRLPFPFSFQVLDIKVALFQWTSLWKVEIKGKSKCQKMSNLVETPHPVFAPLVTLHRWWWPR